MISAPAGSVSDPEIRYVPTSTPDHAPDVDRVQARSVTVFGVPPLSDVVTMTTVPSASTTAPVPRQVRVEIDW